jgi:serine/threonine protein kinase
VQEYCAGGSLANFLKRGHTRSPEHGINFERVLVIMRDVAAGMAYVHAKNIGMPLHPTCLVVALLRSYCSHPLLCSMGSTRFVSLATYARRQAHNAPVCWVPRPDTGPTNTEYWTCSVSGLGIGTFALWQSACSMWTECNRGSVGPEKFGISRYQAVRLASPESTARQSCSWSTIIQLTNTRWLCTAHGDLNPSNILLQVPPSARQDELHCPIDEAIAAEIAARALDSEQCTAKLANFGLSVQFREGVTHASNVKQGVCPQPLALCGLSTEEQANPHSPLGISPLLEGHKCWQ